MNLMILKEDEPALLDRVGRTARDYGIYVAMGLAVIEAETRPPTENKIVVIDPSGRVAISYVKSRPVPGWEAATTKRGDGHLPIVDTAVGRLAAAICFENDFPSFVRRIGASAADLWIAPANDWEAIKRSHFEMVAFRAIENGTPIVRATSAGVSGVFDAYGRVLASTDHFSGARTMIAHVPIGHVPTVYSRIGDLFAWLCVAGLGLSVVLSRWRIY
jgi:apolipoprotein N-acyltransferase